MLPKNVEDQVYRAVEKGLIEIDEMGNVWRVADQRWNRRTKETTQIKCERRRAEHNTKHYSIVRVTLNGVRFHALAHRLVWRHFNGRIPKGLTINHKNGKKKDNRPSNLELATHSEQALHALHVLRVGRIDQYGERNAMAKLTTDQVIDIRKRRAMGEPLKSIADDFGVANQTISKIANGQRRSRG